jgi:hypothetical protein
MDPGRRSRQVHPKLLLPPASGKRYQLAPCRFRTPIMDIPSTCRGPGKPVLAGPELLVTLIRPWLGSIHVIHGCELGAVGVAPRQQ